LLDIQHLDASYDFLQVLWDVSLHIDAGELVALIGPNGAGKTTTLRSVAGFLHPKAGEICFKGEVIGRRRASQISRMGISYVSESLNLFTNMSVTENLLLGAYMASDKTVRQQRLEAVFELFPRLKERAKQLGGTMSGGERKMLAIARGIMAQPQLLLVDEPSLGLAPHLTYDVFRALVALRRQGITILLVEQNVHATLEICDRAYVLEHGRIVMEGQGADLKHNEHVRRAYMGF
jgi:ABC-type branched-subunit amino acid transport system ATPase component